MNPEEMFKAKYAQKGAVSYTIISTLCEDLFDRDVTAIYTRESILEELLPHFEDSDHGYVEAGFELLLQFGEPPYYEVGKTHGGEPLYAVHPEVMVKYLDKMLEEFE